MPKASEGAVLVDLIMRTNKMELKAAFKEGKKMVKFTRYLDEVPIQGKVETSMLSKNFCLSSSAAAGIFVGKHGGFIKVEPGLWIKTKGVK